jgi:hypothetical protein
MAADEARTRRDTEGSASHDEPDDRPAPREDNV